VRKSRLIESLMLKIPLPMFYVASDEVESYQVVDGLQRLSTLRDFVIKAEEKSDDALRLTGLEFWTRYNDCTFNDLPPHLQNRIVESQFFFTIINPSTPERAKRDVFKRINTGGLTLTDQEIRHALYGGEATTLLHELVISDEFICATSNSINDGRMAGRELILRFISFLMRDPSEYRGYTMDEWLSHTMLILNSLSSGLSDGRLLEIVNDSYRSNRSLPVIKVNSIDEIRMLFKSSMKRAYELFGDHAFRKSLPGKESKHKAPVNKGLFEVWSVILCHLDESTFKKLTLKRDELYVELTNLYHDDSFYKTISRDSHKPKSVTARYEIIGNIIQNFLR